MAALNGSEILWVVGRYNGTYAAEEFQTTTQAIAALGGSGGYLHEGILSSGTTATITDVGTNFLVNSVTSGAKTITIPTATGTKQVITITDTKGTADTDNIQAVPASGSIVGNDTVYSNFGSITLYDSATLLQWISQ